MPSSRSNARRLASEAAAGLRTSSMIPFVPRQVIMLETQKLTSSKQEDSKKKKKRREEKETEAAIVEEETKREQKDKKKKKQHRPSETLQLDRPNGGREALLSSIADFLESNGFSRTLSVFRSEAQLEADSRKKSVLNLEDLVCKLLESSRNYEETTIEWLREQDSGKVGMSKNGQCDEVLDVSEHTRKRKRKHRNESDKGIKAEIHKNGLENGSNKYVGTGERTSNKPVDELQEKSKEKGENGLSFEECSAGNPELNGKGLEAHGVETDLKKSGFPESTHTESKCKRKKKKTPADSINEDAEKCHLEDSQGIETSHPVNLSLKLLVSEKEKRKKKNKIICDSNDENENFLFLVEQKTEELKSLTNDSGPSAESNPKHKDEKRKKRKKPSDCLAEGKSLELEASLEVVAKKFKDSKSFGCVAKDASDNIALSNINSELKDKKKKGGEPSSENLCAVSSDQLDGEVFYYVKKGHTDPEVKEALGKSDSRKEEAHLLEEDIGNRKISKKREGLTSEGITSHAENGTVLQEGEQCKLEGAEVSKKIGTREKSDKYSLDNESLNTGKKRKKEKSNENSTKAGMTSSSELLYGPCENSKHLGECHLQKKAVVTANGNVEKGSEGVASLTKKEKHSAEPTSINAFQRVKIDEVEFANERLQDNSYWAKGGADSGYGAKAQEILGQVKGRDFRHEKTKKKRGTYRGGQIDFQSHSIKFNGSDEE